MYELNFINGWHITKNGKPFINFSDDVGLVEGELVLDALRAAQQSVQADASQDRSQSDEGSGSRH